MRFRARLVGAAIAGGLLAGVLLDVLTFLVARYGPQAGSWSFRGNGALVVPLGLGPAVLAAGWTAILLHARGVPGWARIGFMAGMVGMLLVVTSAAAVLLLDMVGAFAAQLLILATWVWMLVAPLLAAVVPGRTRGPWSHPWTHASGAVVFTLGTMLAFYLTGVILPPGS